MLSKLIEMATRSSLFNLKDGSFIDGLSSRVRFPRKYPYRGSYLQFSWDFYFRSVRVTAIQTLAIVCSKDYLHVVNNNKSSEF